MTSANVYITDFWTGEPDVERDALAGAAEVFVLEARREAELLPRVADAAGLLVWHDIRIGAKTIEALEQCRIIVRVGVGFDNVDCEAAARRGIPVCNVPDYGIEDVADHAIAMMLALLRNLSQFNNDLRATPPRWDARRNQRQPRLRGMTLGIVGLGRIGTATALRAQAFGMNVIACDPYIPDGCGRSLGVAMVDALGDLLARSDVFSLHTPLDETTRGLINSDTLALVKPGAILINTARGPICDTTAVLRALESGRLAGAGLDVLPQEPPAADDPLLAAARDPGHPAHHRCVLTPHAAFFTEEGFEEMRRKAALEVRRGIMGEPLRNRVN